MNGQEGTMKPGFRRFTGVLLAAALTASSIPVYAEEEQVSGDAFSGDIDFYDDIEAGMDGADEGDSGYQDDSTNGDDSGYQDALDYYGDSGEDLQEENLDGYFPDGQYVDENTLYDDTAYVDPAAQQDQVNTQVQPAAAQGQVQQPDASSLMPTTAVEPATELTTVVATNSSPAMSMDDVQAMNGGGAIILTEHDKVTFIDGTFFDGQVTDFSSASTALYRVLGLLGRAPDTNLLQYGAMADANGNMVFRFLQMKDSTAIPQGMLKLYTDSSGHVTGISSSLAGYVVPQEGEPITAQQAEAAVAAYLERAGQDSIPVLSQYTRSVLAPNYVSDQDNVPMMNMWAVYTWNPDMTEDGPCDMPYLAHYVNTGGEYRYSMPCFLPPASTSGAPEVTAFDGMTSETWTGTITRNDGSQVTITVPVMYDAVSNMYYLADPYRRIAVADCADFLYGGMVTLEGSSVNDGWDSQLVLAFASFIQAYDFYKGAGFRGADMTEAPILILKDLCAPDGTSADRCVYAGELNGWQTFGIGSEGAYGQALDLIGHAYTHYAASVLSSTGFYQNDFGAATEAICDILGNIMEMKSERTTDTEFLTGEKTGLTVRNMSNPEACGQPAFVGGLYYEPNAHRPNEANGWGGFYADSSLLSLIAYRLYQAGMTLDQCKSYWTTVLSAIGPGLTGQQITVLLPWALNRCGLADFHSALQEALNETLIGYTYAPSSTPITGCGLVCMYLPLDGFLALAEPVLTLHPADEERRLRSWADTTGAVAVQALPGTYTASLTYLDTGSGTMLTLYYDGQQWVVDPAAAAELTVAEGETMELSTAGLL